MAARLSRAAAIAELDRLIASQSFLDFMLGAKVRSDDPLRPGLVPWEPWPGLLPRIASWEAGNSEVMLKDRQLGFTWALAGYQAWRARFFGWQCGVWSVGQREARAFLERVALIDFTTGGGGTHLADASSWPSGGKVLAFPSTEQSGISYTFQLATMDELAFHPWGAANYSALTPTLGAGGQFLAGSTSDPTLGPSGLFYDLYQASKRGETGYVASFTNWRQRPGRDDAWLEAERLKYMGMKEEFDAYNAETDAQAFVGRSGLVYPMFDSTRHVTPAYAPDPWPWEASKMRMAGLDWGGGDPNAIVLLGKGADGRIHQFAEYYETGARILEMAEFLTQWDRRGRIAAVECDPTQTQSVAALNVGALKGRVHEADNAREGIGLTAMLLDKGRLTINPNCKHSIAEFGTYRWMSRTDPNDKSRYRTSTAADNHADGMDARRYGLKKMLRFETTDGANGIAYRGPGMRGRKGMTHVA